jgi:hypothetical protein
MSATVASTASVEDISNARKDVDEAKVKLNAMEKKVAINDAIVDEISGQLRTMVAGDPNEGKKRRDLADAEKLMSAARDSLDAAKDWYLKMQEQLNKLLGVRRKPGKCFIYHRKNVHINSKEKKEPKRLRLINENREPNGMLRFLAKLPEYGNFEITEKGLLITLSLLHCIFANVFQCMMIR